MKTSHRAVLVLGPLAMMVVSLLLYQRADAKFAQLTDQTLEARTAMDEAAPDERSKLQADFDKLLYERHSKETGRGFWGFAVGVSGFFLALALLFTVLEIRHTRRRARLFEDSARQ